MFAIRRQGAAHSAGHPAAHQKAKQVHPAFVAPKIVSIKLPAMTGVVAGQVATQVLPIGYRYHSVKFLFSGITVAQFDNIRVIANGDTFHNLTGTQRDTINKFDKRPAASTTGGLVIPFERSGLRDLHSRYSTALNTRVSGPQTPRPITDLRIEVDVDAAASAPVIACWARVSQPNAHQSTRLLRTEKWQENNPGTSEYAFGHPFVGANAKLRPVMNRLFLNDTNANITEMKALVNNQPIWDRLSLDNEATQSEENLRAPQASWCVVDPTEHGDATQTELWNFTKMTTFDFRYVPGAANTNLNVIMESLGSLAS